MDTWALGCILFELVNGVTPFHCKNEEDLIKKMQEGRIGVGQLLDLPLVSQEFQALNLHQLDIESFNNELKASKSQQNEDSSFS